MIIQCPYCGAKYEAPPGRRFYVCPYCGTVVSEGRVYESVYIFKPAVDKTDAFRRVLNLKPVGSPDDLPAATPTAAELHFVPLYLYHITFQPLPELETYAAAPAVSQPPVELPKGYRFPVRWRTPFKPSLEKMGIFHQPDLNPEASFHALSEVVEEARDYASVFKVRIAATWAFEGIVYYPLWRLEYQYGNRRYTASVDAADGTVLHMEYPLSRRGRAQGAAFAAAALLGSAALGAFVAHWAGLYPDMGALGGGIASTGAALRLAAFATASRGRYQAEAKL
jgi:TFIIB zinc-binding.